MTVMNLYRRGKKHALPEAGVGQMTFRKMEAFRFVAIRGPKLNPGPATFPTQRQSSEWINGPISKG